jgi:hypothetical protein
VVEVLAASGAVSPWFMSHVYDVLKAGAAGAPGSRQGRGGGLRGGAASVLERPLPLSGGDQVGGCSTLACCSGSLCMPCLALMPL